MSVIEIVLIGIALSMDAFAVGLSDGMTEPRMSAKKAAAIAGTFGFFQFLMPVLGYSFGTAFTGVVGAIAPWLSFALLALLGGKMIFDCFTEMRERGEKGKRISAKRKLTAGKLFLQGIATSLDALAVGVTLLAAEVSSGLPAHVTLCSFLIGAITFFLGAVAVTIGRTAGKFNGDRAGFLGGAILVIVGIKILLEGIL